MGNYDCRKNGYLAAWEIGVAHDIFEGRSDEYILENTPQLNIYNEDGTIDKKKRAKARRKLSDLKQTGRFMEFYRSLVTELQVHAYGKALHKIVEQIDCGQPWLENKAANDVLSRISHNVMGDDENTVTVKIEGMPELGTPGAESVEK